MPGRFLPIAEENGLILELGEVVLREACRQASQWARSVAPATRVGVNVSARQFRHPGFVDMVRRVLGEAGLEARLLELEIVENAIVDHEPETISTLQALRAMGVELAIDDFGTGYSSLSYLRRLPINTVKIDQSFVADLPASTQSTAIVRAVVSLAHGLGLKVVAEGVETRAQLDFLRLLGCDSAQGYHLARPKPASELFFDVREQVVVPMRDEAAQ
jgi:EAL domain-containing protein (putative c-di-GMP-specific phosphodiesterase class I)